MRRREQAGVSPRRSSGRNRPVPTLGAGLFALGLIAACTADGAEEPSQTTTTTTLPTPQRVDDGILKIGAMIPAGDPALGDSLTKSFTAEITTINADGGVLGNQIEWVVADEGTTSATAALAIEELLSTGVDAIVGPTSSNAAIGSLDRIVQAGVVACSPTASAIALDEYPDEGLFFRTIATDTLQSKAIAEQAELTGSSRIAIAHIDDDFGRPYAEAAAAHARSFAQVTIVPIAVDETDLTEEVTTLLDVDPQAAFVIGSGDDTVRFLDALGNRDSSGVRHIFVNDAARNAREFIAELPQRLRDRLQVVSPPIVSQTDDSQQAPFDTQVRNCVNLISLAAAQARSDSPRIIAGQMSSVSAGGQLCRSFSECEALLDADLQINYDGPEGSVNLGRNGDPDRATFDLFAFSNDGSDIFIEGRSVTVELE